MCIYVFHVVYVYININYIERAWSSLWSAKGLPDISQMNCAQTHSSLFSICEIKLLSNLKPRLCFHLCQIYPVSLNPSFQISRSFKTYLYPLSYQLTSALCHHKFDKPVLNILSKSLINTWNMTGVGKALEVAAWRPPSLWLSFQRSTLF